MENGKLIYIPKTPFRNDFRRPEMAARGLVDGKIIQVGRHKFLCRIISGLDDPGATATVGGEYNRWVYAMVSPRQTGAAAFE